ncbi:hypothetical protein A1Q2_07711 [Trichosporon asahii var. asahii CBS 8904]|uniref:C2H2-type domain-containing protein n=1 Tax=Trichosporon asahii var. asahii (strain CBS 8904) TaxID=1220162 RepID=K1V1U2_TRIAC|nr:hypothetical protein A1Q2_07711 [Trichosporon asahii var. asahii CBS 8904]
MRDHVKFPEGYIYCCNHCTRIFSERTAFTRHNQIEHPKEMTLDLLYWESKPSVSLLTSGPATPGSAGNASAALCVIRTSPPTSGCASTCGDARSKYASEAAGELRWSTFTDVSLPRWWREDEADDEMDARWDRWQASDGDSEAEGDGARASDDDDDQAFNPEENLVRLYIAAARLGYNLVDVPGDGNCALHAAVHGLRPFGVDADVPSLRAALVEAARCDEEFRDNALSLQEEAELDEWIVKMSHMEEYVDHMGLAALATALARPIVVFSPSSARVATHTPSHVPNMGDPVFLALKPQSFRRDLEAPGPPHIQARARVMLPNLLAEHDRRVANLPALIANAESISVRDELEANGKRLARSLVVVVAGLERGVPPELAGKGNLGIATVSVQGGHGTQSGVAGFGERTSAPDLSSVAGRDGVAGLGDGRAAGVDQAGARAAVGDQAVAYVDGRDGTSGARIIIGGLAIRPEVMDVSLEGGPLLPVTDDWQVESFETALEALTISDSDKSKEKRKKPSDHNGKHLCPHCDQDFASTQGLRDHVKSHLGYVYACNHCPRSYTDRTTFTRHMQLEHPKETSLGLHYLRLLQVVKRAIRILAQRHGWRSTSGNAPPRSASEEDGKSRWPAFTNVSFPSWWREDEDSDAADARWERWQVSDGETEAEGDVAMASDDGDTDSSADDEVTGSDDSDSDSGTEAQVQREKVLLELSPARKSRHPHAEAPPGRPAPSYGVPKEGCEIPGCALAYTLSENLQKHIAKKHPGVISYNCEDASGFDD